MKKRVLRARWMVMFAAVVAAAGAVDAAWQGEALVPPGGGGFVLGWIAPAPNDMREYVPAGERVEDWTRMITIQRFPYRPGTTPEALLARWSEMIGRSCPGARVGEIAPAPLGSHPGAQLRLDCPRNPQTGKPETVIGRVVIGDTAVHMAQAALRRVPTEADARWALGVVGGVRLCGDDAACYRWRDAAVGAPL